MEHDPADTLRHLLRQALDSRSRDLLLTAGRPPSVKTGEEHRLLPLPPLTAAQTQALARTLLTGPQAARFEDTGDAHVTLTLDGIGRVRAHLFGQQGQVGIAVHVLPDEVPTLAALGLPASLQTLALARRGLCLLVGMPGGATSSAALAAMVDWRNRHGNGHILCLGDPLAFVHRHQGCALTQRDIGTDTPSWQAAFDQVHRLDPDVVAIGEIRDAATLERVLDWVEQGRLCLATLNAIHVTQALERLAALYPEAGRGRLYEQLAWHLRGMVALRTVPSAAGPGRLMLAEVLLNTPQVTQHLCQGQLSALLPLMHQSRPLGMQTFDQALFEAHRAGDITYEDALRNAHRFNELRLRIKCEIPSAGGRMGQRPGLHLVASAPDSPFPSSPSMSMNSTLATPQTAPSAAEPAAGAPVQVTVHKVAFLGLGVMGYPMAGHLARAGHQVTVYNRTAAKAQAWCAEFGGRLAATPREAAQGAEFVFSCVGNDDDLRSVMLGADGAFAGLEPGAVVVDHTTASADVARELGGAARTLGLRFVDAPVSGGQAGAQNGVLTVMCGGEQAAFDRARPLVMAFARACTRMGDSGAGQLTKMVNQICIGGLLQGLAEAIAFGQKAGLDMNLVLDVIGKGAAQSWQMDNRGKTMVADQFDFGFAVDWMRKDLGLVLDEARRNGATLPVTALVDQFYAEVQRLGGQRWDTSSLIKRLR